MGLSILTEYILVFSFYHRRRSRLSWLISCYHFLLFVVYNSSEESDSKMSGSALAVYGLDASDLPQDPYYPQSDPDGPTFLDTGACVCALQTLPPADSDVAAWQCIGNQTQDVYVATTGKWFKTFNNNNNVDLPIYDASNGPDNSTTYRWDDDKAQLVKLTDQSSLTGYDRACTAVNQTTFSTAFYRAADEIARNVTPVDAAPCWRPGAVPIQLQNLTLWESNGCLEGFLCEYNFPYLMILL